MNITAAGAKALLPSAKEIQQCLLKVLISFDLIDLVLILLGMYSFSQYPASERSKTQRDLTA